MRVCRLHPRVPTRSRNGFYSMTCTYPTTHALAKQQVTSTGATQVRPTARSRRRLLPRLRRAATATTRNCAEGAAQLTLQE